MIYIIIGLICFIIGYHLGCYKAKILKLEVFKTFLILDEKIKRIQERSE